MLNEYVAGNAEDDGYENARMGWFVGHFMPPESGLRRNSAVEVKWGVHAAGEEKRSIRTNLESTTLTLLISGCFAVGFPKLDKEVILQRPGDYVLFAPGVEHKWVARSASTVVTVRWPSATQGSTIPEMNGEIAVGRRLLAEVCAQHAQNDSSIMQGLEGEQAHAFDVLAWVRKLRPDAPSPLCLAALFHDIDRVVTPNVGGGFKGIRRGPEYALHKKRHANRSAAFIAPLLRERGFSSGIVDRALFLIVHHDDTGEEVAALADADLDCLVAADGFAFFTSIAPALFAAEGETRTRDKIRFMVEKLPESARLLLREHRLQREVFERLKTEVIAEYYSRRGSAGTDPVVPSL
jgi:hypothetical protein